MSYESTVRAKGEQRRQEQVMRAWTEQLGAVRVRSRIEKTGN